MSNTYKSISNGMIETLEEEARSAEIKVGTEFVRTGESSLGIEGTINGYWSHQPGLNSHEVDPTPFSRKIKVLLRHENIVDESLTEDTFYAKFVSKSFKDNKNV